jgi:hypothetical protein
MFSERGCSVQKFSFAEALKAKESLSAALFQKGGVAATDVPDDAQRAILNSGRVQGIGVGLLDPDDEAKGAVIVLYATKALKQQDAKTLENGVTVMSQNQKVAAPTRVVRTGEFIANTSTLPNLTHRDRTADRQTRVERRDVSAFTDGEYKRKVRPLPGGYTIGTPWWSGTAGLIVINSPGQNQLYVLSNNHVLNKDNSSGYTENIQPGGADGGVSGTDTIGRLDRYVPLSRTGDNYLDAATSIPGSNSMLDPRYGRNRIVVPGHYLQYSVGWKFIKAGRTTEDVAGVVDSVHTDVQINYGSYGGLGTITFKDQSVIKGTGGPVSLPGDSGSVWLRDTDRYACAVNYAGPNDGSYSIAYPINWFMTAFKCLVAIPNTVANALSPEVSEAAKFTTEMTAEFQELLESLVQSAQ